MSQTEDIKLPNQVVDSDWRDDVDFEEYANEGTYVSPKKVTKTTISKIKKSPIKLSIRNLVDWGRINETVAS